MFIKFENNNNAISQVHIYIHFVFSGKKKSPSKYGSMEMEKRFLKNMI